MSKIIKSKNRGKRFLGFQIAFYKYKLFVLSLACSLRLFLALYAGLFVVLSLTKLGKDSRTSALSFEATKSTVK